MKITTQVEIDVAAKAVLRDGKLSLSVTAAAPYGSRSATATVESFSDETTAAVEAALQAAIDEALEASVRAAQDAAAKARAVAIERGEVL